MRPADPPRCSTRHSRRLATRLFCVATAPQRGMRSHHPAAHRERPAPIRVLKAPYIPMRRKSRISGVVRPGSESEDPKVRRRIEGVAARTLRPVRCVVACNVRAHWRTIRACAPCCPDVVERQSAGPVQRESKAGRGPIRAPPRSHASELQQLNPSCRSSNGGKRQSPELTAPPFSLGGAYHRHHCRRRARA